MDEELNAIQAELDAVAAKASGDFKAELELVVEWRGGQWKAQVLAIQWRGHHGWIGPLYERRGKNLARLVRQVADEAMKRAPVNVFPYRPDCIYVKIPKELSKAS